MCGYVACVLAHRPHNHTLYRVILLLEAPDYLRNAFKCAWMCKETIFSISYEQVLVCIVPGMCI
jgi:hypothetical protein